MEFKSTTAETYAQKLGYLLSYFIFTTIFYFVFLHSPQYTYLHAIGITFGITIIGTSIKRLLK